MSIDTKGFPGSDMFLIFVTCVVSLLLLLSFIKLIYFSLYWGTNGSWNEFGSANSSQSPLPGITDENIPRLSRHPSLIRPEYDVVVIGSGYGGGVAASRMARAGKSVCLLERGTEIWPGEFPHTLKAALRTHHVTDRSFGQNWSVGNKSGLFQTTKGEGQDVFSGCGLGGTSLINAGVFLRADERILRGGSWPIEFRETDGILNQYYERAEWMLQPSPYPEAMLKPRKLSTFEAQASNINLHDCFYRPPLTTSFEHCINHAGVRMRQSLGSGNECTGVNDGSKFSVLVTYLADAWNWGTEIFCGIDVKYLRRNNTEKGYVVFYEVMDASKKKKHVMWVRAKELVFLGAGALGTTEILLRSRTHGLSTSPLLGQRISGNGDLLAFAYDCNRSINGVGRESISTPLSKQCGPTITGCIDLRCPTTTPDANDGFVVQEGVVPEALGSAIQAILETQMSSVPSPKYKTSSQAIARAKSWLLGPYCEGGSVNRTAVYLIMSHDENEGTLGIKDDKFTLQWSGIGAEQRCRKVNDLLASATASIGGTLINMPCITVHPLGGVCMSSDNTGYGGVVNQLGQLYQGQDDEVYKGIICVDASIIPTSLALAERSCDIIIRDRDWKANNRDNGILDFGGKPHITLPASSDLQLRAQQIQQVTTTAGLRFDEVLQGFLRVSDDDLDFETASKVAEQASSTAQLSITVSLHRLDQGSYKGFATGTLSCGALSQDPLLITRGLVRFFTADAGVSDAVNLIYDLDLLSTLGKAYSFQGYKRIDSSIAFSATKTWIATTTLYTTITQDKAIVARGILRVTPQALINELQTLRCDHDVNIAQRVYTKVRFLRFFASNIASYVLSPFRPLQYPTSRADKTGHFMKANSFETWITASDGVQFRIKMWEPLPDAGLKKTPIVLIPGASVDDQIFSLPTIPMNTIDYFTVRGYRCYVPVLRFGIGHEAKNGWTVFDARLDVKAALQYVRKQENDRKVYAIVHCLGSIATATALLHGDVEASWFCGLTCSQVFTDLIYSKDNNFKAGHQILIKAYRAIAGNWFPCHSTPAGRWLQYLLDQMLRFYPVGAAGEMCNSSVCHRCDVPFGRCWNHDNLNHETHVLLGDFFDGIHMDFLTHLSKMGVMPSQHLRSNLPEFVDLVTPDNVQRLAGLRVCFLSGGDNAVWQPGATKRSFDMLKKAFPNMNYERITCIQELNTMSSLANSVRLGLRTPYW
ncbi:FAD/NAD(P)-binding domain-containing protein [Dothidotthia symphoricarpi CBS 119687]|uniref:FAD/NAD(P)-binding domain-containing protein n=1 Tax=Dothidotthia symphoricarpi CBS 119687 TaxID=1392245 RepID=A0A6A6A6S4_9PLEO|nr:FAD/NAD(P)-binding domain-containing protein [Dothidotthia symphoricarpi CBS 119687]KAF2126321.1 FAD/NAD(P)-binding domain-containing protein [Dothidotthia symphoricarpi CBS 119687]